MNIVVRVLAEGFYRIMYDLHFEGLENIPKNGGTIYASNHRSYHDPVFITMRVPKKFNYMAKEELFKKIWDMDSIGDIATVTVHIKKIREKIEKDTANPQYIETIWGVGYRFKV